MEKKKVDLWDLVGPYYFGDFGFHYLEEEKKDFLLFFLFFLVKIGLIVLTFKEQFRAQRSVLMFGFYKPSYILLIPTLIFVIIEAIEAWLVYYYNRYCTNKLLANGYYPEENDEYSIALLKEFTYIPYTKEELEDKSIREKYKKFSDFARKEERDKFKIFFSVWLIIGAIIFIIWAVEYLKFYNF